MKYTKKDNINRELIEATIETKVSEGYTYFEALGLVLYENHWKELEIEVAGGKFVWIPDWVKTTVDSIKEIP